MTLVVVSIAMLIVAPLLASVLLRRPPLAAALDGFVLVAVGGIVALHVVPQSASLAGATALAAAVLGLFLPILLHRVDDAVLSPRARVSSGSSASSASSALSASSARRARDVALFVVFLLGVVVHALFDGAALGATGATGETGATGATGATDGHALAFGVILHRVPVGLALWVVARPKLGTVRTVVVVVTYAAGTVIGSLVGPTLLAHASAPALAVFQAFVAGSILHIVAESPALPLPKVRPQPAPFLRREVAPAVLRAPPPSSTIRFASLVGSALAAAALWWTERAEHHGGHAEERPELATVMLHLAVAIAPAALLSFLVVGVLFALFPEHAPRFSRSRGMFVDAVRGAAAGLPHPLCSCAVAPLYDELVDADAPPATARAFLVAAPALGVPAVFLSARLFGLPFTAARIAAAALLAIAAGLSATARSARPARSARSSQPSSPSLLVPSSPFARRLVHGLRHGIVDSVDHVGPWLLLGVAVAAAIEINVEAGALASVSSTAQIGVASLIALPLYLCAAGMTPIAFALVGKGASLGAVLALLVVGPTTSLPTFALVKKHHGTGAAAAIAIVVVLAATICGVAIDAFASSPLVSAPPAATPMAAEAGPVTMLQMASLAALALLIGSSFVRQGVRGFLVQVMSPQHAHAGDDVHGAHCAHDHGPALAPAPIVRIAVPFDPRGKR